MMAQSAVLGQHQASQDHQLLEQAVVAVALTDDLVAQQQAQVAQAAAAQVQHLEQQQAEQ
jgi:hypothetical protein